MDRMPAGFSNQMPDNNPSARKLRELYSQGVNIMAWFRKNFGDRFNTSEAVGISYDLQSGSYVKALEDPSYRSNLERYGSLIAGVLKDLPAETLLEAGVGEATSLCEILGRSGKNWKQTAGFDLSWSRIAVARCHAAKRGQQPRLFTGNLLQIPVRASAFDIVLTSHAIEPNHGQEHRILSELSRISRRWIVLCEPSYELGGETTRSRIKEHGYCRGLPEVAAQLGLRIVEHRILDNQWREDNQTGLLILEKQGTPESSAGEFLACPVCSSVLDSMRGHFFCPECLTIYPVLEGIPCLLPQNAILASLFEDSSLFTTP